MNNDENRLRELDALRASEKALGAPTPEPWAERVAEFRAALEATERRVKDAATEQARTEARAKVSRLRLSLDVAEASLALQQHGART